MKKRLGIAGVLALVAIALFNIGAFALPVGDVQIENYVYRWEWTVPQISVNTTVCQATCDSKSIWVNVSGMECGQRAYLYVVIEENQLIETRLVGNGLYQIVPPSRYNNGNWKVGPQHYVVILSTTPRFQFANGWHPATVTTESFLGYPSSGYVIVKDGFFNVYPGYDCEYWRCCACHCP